MKIRQIRRALFRDDAHRSWVGLVRQTLARVCLLLALGAILAGAFIAYWIL